MPKSTFSAIIKKFETTRTVIKLPRREHIFTAPFTGLYQGCQ